MTSNFIDIGDLKKRKDFTLGYGHFTTIHPGHIRYLKHAKSLGNTLIVSPSIFKLIIFDKKFSCSIKNLTCFFDSDTFWFSSVPP